MNIRLTLLTALAISAFFITPTSLGVVEVNQFETVEEEKRYKELLEELRCPKCQNQNLLDSDAPIAKDLRRRTRSLIEEGKSNEEVKSYMLDRYGDFVLYKPRFNAATALLWLGPFILLVVVVMVLLRRIKNKTEEELLKPSQSDDEATRIKVRNLMSNSPDLTQDSGDAKP